MPISHTPEATMMFFLIAKVTNLYIKNKQKQKNCISKFILLHGFWLLFEEIVTLQIEEFPTDMVFLHRNLITKMGIYINDRLLDLSKKEDRKLLNLPILHQDKEDLPSIVTSLTQTDYLEDRLLTLQ